MKQNRMGFVLGLALALACMSGGAVTPAHAAAKSGGTSTASTKSSKPSQKSAALHQFTGVVTAVDKASLTVEKSGKTPRTVVFARHAEMSAQGDVERNARVTVYYRDEDGHSVAHKVVVKTSSGAAK